MLKKLNQITNITIGSFVGVFIGCGIYVFWDYKKHPDLYTMQSAPWYTSIFVYGIVMLIFVTVAIIAKLIIRKKMKKEKLLKNGLRTKEAERIIRFGSSRL